MEELRAFVNDGLRELEHSREEEPENHHGVKIEGALCLFIVPHHLACALTIFLSLAALINLGFIFFAIFRPAPAPQLPPQTATPNSHFTCVPNFFSRNFLILYPERFFIIVSPQVPKSPTKVSLSSPRTRASSFSHYISPPTHGFTHG